MNGRSRRSAGFVLPFVIFSLAAATLLVMAFAGEGLQAMRAVRASVAGTDAAQIADAALALAQEEWPRDSLWAIAPGIPVRRTIVVGGAPVTVEWQRHHPLAATVRAVRDVRGTRRLDAITRDHLRAVWLRAPLLPVGAALATNGTLTGAEGSLISGSDLALPGSPCGRTRDTLSVPSLVAAGVREVAPGAWPGAPVALAPVATLSADLSASLDELAAYAPRSDWDSAPRALPNAPGWQALRIRATEAVIRGPTAWRGLLVVHGDLTVTGPLDITGILVVQGRLDVTAAQFAVQGAIVVADTSAKGVMLGGRARVFYDRCAVQMALATVARPSFAPFSLWQSLAR